MSDTERIFQLERELTEAQKRVAELNDINDDLVIRGVELARDLSAAREEIKTLNMEIESWQHAAQYPNINL